MENIKGGKIGALGKEKDLDVMIYHHVKFLTPKKTVVLLGMQNNLHPGNKNT